MRGAGGTQGGLVRFFLGLAMMIGGGYLFFTSIQVGGYGFGNALYSFGGFGVNTGMILIPFIFGIGFLFYNAKNPIGWVLSAGSLLALAFGVIRSLRFHFRGMSAFDLIVILVLLFGGIGLFLSSLRDYGREQE